MIIDFAGKVVQSGGGREGINKVYLVFQLEDSILVNASKTGSTFVISGFFLSPAATLCHFPAGASSSESLLANFGSWEVGMLAVC